MQDPDAFEKQEHELSSILREHFRKSPYTLALISTNYFALAGKNGRIIGFIKVFPTVVKCSSGNQLRPKGERSWSQMDSFIDFHDPDAFEKLDHEISKMGTLWYSWPGFNEGMREDE